MPKWLKYLLITLAVISGIGILIFGFYLLLTSFENQQAEELEAFQSETINDQSGGIGGVVNGLLGLFA
jgi:hypothetical protein